MFLAINYIYDILIIKVIYSKSKTMEHITRRKFLKNTVTSGAVLALWGWNGKSQGEAKESVSRIGGAAAYGP